jgi:MftR C-terminal domain
MARRMPLSENAAALAERGNIVSWLSDSADMPPLRRFRTLVTDTPSLSAYLARMWARHTDALAAAIAAELGLAATPPLVRALAYLAVQAPVVARGADGDPREQLDANFTLLRTG